ncbi:acidic mammalian chitinase [Caerostris extrusa]|uniref:Acidic mammalian chitinase n=1 Tax=Caerostris extrusa TaxID=172846 RepID=A0AAV4NCG0_CAEEX|nr:acidic mammalian chitinase [Caerostris extrusa]
MGTLSVLILCLSIFCITVQSNRLTSPKNTNSKKIVCYFTNWAQYRPNEGKYVPEDIEPTLPKTERKECTKDWWKSRTRTKMPKFLLAIGGWSFGTQRFKEMASNRYNRQLFVFSAIRYLRDRNFDGLDLDWEFPRGGDDKKNFVLVLKELREAFEEEAKDKKMPRLLLTIAVSAGSETIRSGYDVPAVAAYCDFINIMSYDFHGKWESQTGHNSPLYALSTESQWRKQLCMVKIFILSIHLELSSLAN